MAKPKALKLPGFNERQSILGARRGLKMARSAHAYVRGNTKKFYEWLGTSAAQNLPHAPQYGSVVTATLGTSALLLIARVV